MQDVVRILNNEEVAELLDLSSCMHALEEAFTELGRENAVTLHRRDIMTAVPALSAFHSFKVMGGVVPSMDVAAVRLDSDLLHWPEVAGLPRRMKLTAAQNPDLAIGKENGLVVLYQISSGQLICMMTDGEIQRVRVGLTSALATKLLARQDSATVACLGSGYQADPQLRGLDLAMAPERIVVYSPNHAHRDEFVERMDGSVKAEMTTADSADEAVRDADVIIVSTNSIMPVVDHEWLVPGVHVSCINPNEMSAEAIDRCDVMVVTSPVMNDSTIAGSVRPDPALLANMQENPPQWRRERSRWEAMASLGDVMVGKRDGRRSAEQVTAYVGHGAGVQFAALGYLAYQAATEQDAGLAIPAGRFLQTIYQT